MKIKKPKLEEISNLNDKELSEIAHSLGIDLNGVALELEPGKFFLKDRNELVKLIENRYEVMCSIESITIAKRANRTSIVAVIAAIVSAIVSLISIFYH